MVTCTPSTERFNSYGKGSGYGSGYGSTDVPRPDKGKGKGKGEKCKGKEKGKVKRQNVYFTSVVHWVTCPEIATPNHGTM